jgi:hypothetical protein
MKIKVIEINELESGGADLILEIDDEYKEFIQTTFQWDEWSESKFSQFIIESLRHYCELKLQNPEKEE